MNAWVESGMVLVAGATGLAGSSIVRSLLTRLQQVRVRGTYQSTQPFWHHPRLEYVPADLTRREDCLRVCEGCHAAILAAAVTGGAAAVNADPHAQLTENIVMDARLLEACASRNIQNVVFISTGSVYPPLTGKITEEQLDWTVDPAPTQLGAGWAKRIAERLCHYWHKQTGMHIVVLRSANIYGPFAAFAVHRSNFIPALIRKAADAQDPFEVWGRPDIIRDVIFADDFGCATVEALLRKDIQYDVFNLGTGRPVTVGEVVDCVLEVSGHHPQRIEYKPTMPSGVSSRVLNCTKYQETFHWKPAEDLAAGITRTMEWWKENQTWWLR